jgi:hypothetical protein
MYNKCPVCAGNRIVSFELNTFMCPYCRASGHDLYPEWTLQRKMNMLNLVANKPVYPFVPNTQEIVHTPTPILNVNKQRGRPKKTA